MPDSVGIIDGAGAARLMATHKPADNIHRPVHHSEVRAIQASIQRPNDVTAYIAGDAIGDAAGAVFSFDIGALGYTQGAVIVGARVIRNTTASPTVRFRGMVHDAAVVTAPAADNAAAPLLWANRASRRGWVDFPTSMASVAAGGDCLEWAGVLSNVQGLVVAPADGIVRVVLQTLDGFVPVALITTLIELDVVV